MLLQLQEANAQLAEQACSHDVEMTPVQRRIEPRSADDSLSGVVRCLYFADTFLRDGEPREGTGWRSGPQLASRKWTVGGGGWAASSRGWTALLGASYVALATGCPALKQLPCSFW